MVRTNPVLRLVAGLATLVAVLGGAAPAGAGTQFPARIPLPNGFRPEGIVIGRGNTFYVGSLANGALYRGGMLNFNGIEATPNGDALIAIQTATGKLFSIDPDTGVTTLIDVGGALFTNGDGLLLAGHTLYVVRNQNNVVVVVRLSGDFT